MSGLAKLELVLRNWRVPGPWIIVASVLGLPMMLSVPVIRAVAPSPMIRLAGPFGVPGARACVIVRFEKTAVPLLTFRSPVTPNAPLKTTVPLPAVVSPCGVAAADEDATG